MIDYIDNAIRATSGEDICLVAKATDAYGDILEACSFHLHDDNEVLFAVEGLLNDDGIWEFHIPARATANFKGRYWYSVHDEHNISLCFKSPIYFM